MIKLIGRLFTILVISWVVFLPVVAILNDFNLLHKEHTHLIIKNGAKKKS